MGEEYVSRRDRYLAYRRTVWASVQDIVGPFSKWPMWLLDSFVKEHKNFDERFALFKFLWANGMDPREIPRAIMVNERGLSGYDSNARAQLDWCVNKALNSDYFQQFRIYIVEKGRPL